MKDTLTYEGIMGTISSNGLFYEGGTITSPNGTLTTTPSNDTYWTTPNYTYYWPVYSPDKTSQAFRLIKVLMDKKLVKVTSIKQFIDLVDSIAQVL